MHNTAKFSDLRKAVIELVNGNSITGNRSLRWTLSGCLIDIPNGLTEQIYKSHLRNVGQITGRTEKVVGCVVVYVLPSVAHSVQQQ